MEGHLLAVIFRYQRTLTASCDNAGEAVGKSSLVPVPYDWIQKDPGCVVAHGLPEGVTLKKPSEYDTKTLMKILEQSHRIQFTVKR